MKKYIAAILALLLLFSVAGCHKGSSKGEDSTSDLVEETGKINDGVFRVGFIFPAETDAPETKARMEAVRKMQKQIGLADDQVILAENISKDKGDEVIDSLIQNGCDIIFGLSVRYEDSMVNAAKANEKVQFCIEGGRNSIECGLDNVHTFNSKIFEAYYVCGIVAGMKINDMLNDGKVTPNDCRIGFVAYKEAPETTSCINAFYLGVKQVCSQTSIEVCYVEKRGNYDADGKAARKLVASGVDFMCQYTFTTAVAAVCAENEIPVFGNEISVISVAPNMAMTSTYTDWSVYYLDAVKTAMDQKEIPKDWVGGYKKGVVRVTPLNDIRVVKGTAERVMEVEKKLRKGDVKIFDTNAMYKDGQTFASLIKTNPDFAKYKSNVKNGIFNEQSLISAPIMETLIDGIHINKGSHSSSSSDSEDSAEE